MAKHGRSAGCSGFGSPPPSPLGSASPFSAPSYRARGVPTLPGLSPLVDAPDTAAMAQRIAADIASLPARRQARLRRQARTVR